MQKKYSKIKLTSAGIISGDTKNMIFRIVHF